MRFSAKVICGLLIVAAWLAPGRSEAKSRFNLVEGDVVVFLGGTNMVRLQRSGHLEARLARAFAEAKPRFRDLSWEADTVYRLGSVIERWRKDGFGGFAQQLQRVEASVAVCQFGRIESLDGAKALPRFRKAYEQLLDAVQKRARLVVLVSPTPFDKPPSDTIPDLTAKNAILAEYVKATEDIAKRRGLVFVDLFRDAKPGLTDNGMHIRDEAQEHVASTIANQLGVATDGDLAALRKAVVEKHRLWYDYWRPANWKLLYGDDSRRVFTRGGKDSIPFREEWKKLLPMIAVAERRVWTIAAGGDDPGHVRPKPEVLHGDPSADIEQERRAFTVADGLEVNLFASEKEGLTSPLAIRWDPEGRMYVSVTTTYPHVFPGDVPNDKIIVLEDTDKDGKADKSTVFAEGLNIPTGLELGDGGVYVGQNSEMMFLKDTDGDGKADVRRVLLGGFGNGDSHQTINSFVWSPGGELFFGQGDGCESRVETPWGASNLFQAGFYRFRPRRLRLHPLLDDFMGPGNPWGVAFDAWGQIFSIDGAGGVAYLSPGQVPTSHRKKLRTIGQPGGYCGIGYLDGRHLPESMRGDFVVGDFKSNRVKRFSVKERGAGFELQWKQPLLQSRHRNFRPVDVKVGPDGAVYVVDWYNPITCHQDDAYRDPRRDKAHGRIWRVASKSKPVAPPNLRKAALADVVDSLRSPEYWTRYQAKRALTERDSTEASKALDEWVRKLDPKSTNYEHHLFEALGAYETLEVVEPRLLRRLLEGRDARARAYAVRVVGRWHDRLESPLDLLAPRVEDEHPRVRMEAAMACASIPSPKSMAVAARVVDRPRDEWIDYAFEQSVHHLKGVWLPAFERGAVTFSRPNHLAAVANIVGGRAVLGNLKKLVDSGDLTGDAKVSAIDSILSVGSPQDWQRYGFDRARLTEKGKYSPGLHARVLARMVEIARVREVRPTGDLADTLTKMIDSEHPDIKRSALALTGIWKVDAVIAKVVQSAKDESLPVEVRSAALAALASSKAAQRRELLVSFSVAPHPLVIRAAGIRALVEVDVQAAARQAGELMPDPRLPTVEATKLFAAFMKRAGGDSALSLALDKKQLTPKVSRKLLQALFSSGNSNRNLFMTLNRSLGDSLAVAKYSEDYVKGVVLDSAKQGKPERGAQLFQSLACATCHKVGGAGGEVGPDLTAIGTTLAPDRIVEEVLWPNRQVKEGFSVVQVVTTGGSIHQGYQRRTKESEKAGDIVLEELTSRKRVTIRKNDIDEKTVVGSAMPTGLTAVLSRQQLADLIRYLTDRGKIE